MADYQGRWLGCNSCSLNTVTSLSNTTAGHSVCKHLATLCFLGCWGNISLHPCTTQTLAPSRSSRNNSNKGDLLAVCPKGSQPLCWCDTGAQGTWPMLHMYSLRGGTNEHYRKRCFLRVTDSQALWRPCAGIPLTTGAARSAVCRDSPGGKIAFGIMLLQQGWD